MSGINARPTATETFAKPICGAFLRCAFMPFRVLPARLPNSMLCLRSLRCYALNCIRI